MRMIMSAYDYFYPEDPPAHFQEADAMLLNIKTLMCKAYMTACCKHAGRPATTEEIMGVLQRVEDDFSDALDDVLAHAGKWEAESLNDDAITQYAANRVAEELGAPVDKVYSGGTPCL